MALEIKENLQSLFGISTIWNEKILRSLEISKCETLKMNENSQSKGECSGRAQSGWDLFHSMWCNLWFCCLHFLMICLKAGHDAEVCLAFRTMVLCFPTQDAAVGIGCVPAVVTAKGWTLPGFWTVTELFYRQCLHYWQSAWGVWYGMRGHVAKMEDYFFNFNQK